MWHLIDLPPGDHTAARGQSRTTHVPVLLRATPDCRVVGLRQVDEMPHSTSVQDQDFWLVDEDLVVLMHYDDAGQFLGGEALPETETPRYVAVRDAAWAAATPFEPWWAARPQYHRCSGPFIQR